MHRRHILAAVRKCVYYAAGEHLMPPFFRFSWIMLSVFFFFFSSRRRHTRFDCDWSSDVCSSDLFPMEIAARHPGWWGQPSDEESLNAHEGELLTEQLEELMGRPVAVRYEKVFSSGEGDLVRRLPAHLAQDGVTALVFNFVDQLTHGRSESAILYEVARDEAALRSLALGWVHGSTPGAGLRRTPSSS